MCKHGREQDTSLYLIILKRLETKNKPNDNLKNFYKRLHFTFKSKCTPFQEFHLTCPALGKRGLVTGGCGAGTVAVGAGGLLRMPGAETACAWVIGGIPGRGTGGGIPTEKKCWEDRACQNI